jgi:hypothetical protein
MDRDTTTRSLRLHRETLTELTAQELVGIQAGQNLTPVINTLPLKSCFYSAPNQGCWETEACNSRSCDPQ